MASVVLTSSELERLSAQAPHGTHARYNAHLLAGDESCDACRDAEAGYRAELRARRTDRGRIEQPRHHLILRSRLLDQAVAGQDDLEIDDDETEDDGELEDERSWADDLENADEEDDVGDEDDDEDDVDDEQGSMPWIVAAASILGNVLASRGEGRVPSPSPVESHSMRVMRRSASTSAPGRSAPADPRTRLRAITDELDDKHPRGRAAVELLVEAAPALGGVKFLRQYGEARGCDPIDVVAAERAATALQGQTR